MTTSNFIPCFNDTAGFEGGYVNNPHDPGHGTMNGVTQAVYTDYLRKHNRPDAHVIGISLADRQAIYREDFWNRVRGDELYAGLDLCMVDTAWGSGPVEAIKLLQRALGLTADGEFGPKTFAALKQHENSTALISKVCDERMAFFKSLVTWKFFGRGWTTRLNGIEAKALAMHGVSLTSPQAANAQGVNAAAPLPELLRKVTDPIAAAPAKPQALKESESSTMGNLEAMTMNTTQIPAPPSLFDTLENLLTAAVDAAPEVSRDYVAAVKEFQALKASPIGMDLSKLIGQLFSHATASNSASLSSSGQAASVAIVVPKISTQDNV